MAVKRLAIIFSLLVAVLVVYQVGTGGSGSPTRTQAPTGTRRAEPIMSSPTTTKRTAPPITAARTDCHWRRYSDGAIASDRRCAPGRLNPAVAGHTAQTICSRAWVASADELHRATITRDRLLIEYQLPGSPLTYVVAHVIPVQDGGSATSPANLYPLPLNGWGGEHTQTVVSDRLHAKICSGKITVAQAARILRGDWLAKGLPVD